MTKARRALSDLRALLGWRGASLVVIASATGLAVARGESVIALVGPAVGGGLGLVILVQFLSAEDDEAEMRRILHWTAAAFVLHLLLGLLITNTLFLLRYLGPDALTYHGIAQDIVRHWTDGYPAPYVPSGKEGFYYLLAGLYRLLGPYTSAGLAVNAVLAAALVPITTDSTRRLFGSNAARYAAPLTVLLPGLLLWTSQLLKESAVLFLLAVAANCSIRISQRISITPLFLLATTTALLFTFRGWVGVMAGGGLIIGIVFSRRQLLSGLGTGATAVVLIGVLVIVTGVGYSGYTTAVSADLEQASELRRNLATTANSGIDPDTDVSTPARALSYLPKALVTFLLGPFPWQIRGGRQLPVIPDLLCWWALLPSLWRGLRSSAHRYGRQIFVLLLPAFTTSVLLALSIGNFGTLLRERTQIFIILAPFICLGLSLRSGARGRKEPKAATSVH
jgi:hypothetical protein